MDKESSITHLNVPISFLNEMAEAETIDKTLSCIALWLPQFIAADRASICLDDGDDAHLRVYALSGNKAIPLESKLLIANSMVGRVFRSQKLEIAEKLEGMVEQDCQILADSGLATRMDAPMIKSGICFGTLNVARSKEHSFSRNDAVILKCFADWTGSYLLYHQQLNIQRKLAITDPLTGVRNRRSFFNFGQKLMSSWLSFQTRFSIVAMDIDRFKRINDSYGHDAGDCALKALTHAIEQIVRENDLLARTGGEEFVIIIDGEDSQISVDLAKRIQSVTDNLTIDYNGQEFALTLSIGITQVTHNDYSFEQVFSRADRALYQSKKLGRNRISVL